MIFKHLHEKKKLSKRLREALSPTEHQLKGQRDKDWIREQNNPNYANKKILVLGAGVAGLNCAFELGRKGFNVTILEAEGKHIGGRVRTHRKETESGEIYIELGAMRIPASHNLTLGYMDEFGLEKRNFVIYNENAKTNIRGKVFTNKQIEDNEELVMDLYDLTDEERELGYGGIWDLGIADIWSGLTPTEQEEYFSIDLKSPNLIKLDYKALATMFDDVVLSEGKKLSKEAREYVMTRMGLETNLPISASEFLREERDGIWGKKFYEIIGGTDLLPKAFHSRLPRNVRLVQQAKVTRIIQPRGQNPIVTYQNKNKELVEENGFDWVICTIPLGVLNLLDIESAFTPQKLRAIQGVNYDASSKVIGYSPRRWWEQEGIYGGGDEGDTAIGSTWFPNDNTHKDREITNSPSFFLASYTWSQLGKQMSNIPNAQVDAVMRRVLGNMHPSIKINPSLYKTELKWPWDSYPFAAGAYAFFMPGEQYRFYKELVEPDGKIFLTGEHVSHTHAWIQGSFESALHTSRAIMEIVNQETAS